MAHIPSFSSPVWARHWLAVLTGRKISAADPAPATWRDDAQQTALVVGAWAANFLPAAWVAEGRLSTDLLRFGLRTTVVCTICTVLQLATLRWLRQARGSLLRRPFAQWAVLATGGVVLHLTLSHAALVLDGQPLRSEDSSWWTGAVGAWTTLLLSAYLVWQREAQDRARAATQRLRSIQHAQLAARRTLAEQELVALQAQIDPELFFGTLDTIQALHGGEPARAEALLDALIAFLRAALPQQADGHSTLAHEIDVAVAFVRMHATARGTDMSLASEVDRALLQLPMTPGLLLPLLRGTLDECTGTASLRLGARLASEGVLELRLAAPSLPSEASCRTVDAALRAVHGASAVLLRSTGFIQLRLPHVAA